MGTRLRMWAPCVMGAVGMLLGFLVFDWYHGRIELPGFDGLGAVGTARLWPTSTELCLGGSCHAVANQGGGAFGGIVLGAGALSAIGAVLITVLRAVNATVPRRLIHLVIVGGVIALMATAVTMMMIGPADVSGSTGLGGLCALLGTVGIAWTGFDAMRGDSALAEGAMAMPIKVAVPQRRGPVQAAPARTPDYQRVIDDATHSDPLTREPAPSKVTRPSPTAPNAADAARLTLRFVAATLDINSLGLEASFEKLGTVTLPWTRLVRVVARRMPPDPPFDKLIFIDLVADDGTPIRLLPSTRVNYSALPGGQAPNSRENFRRLCAYAVANHVGIAVDDETKAFVDGGREPPMFLAIKKFAEYDAGYRAREAAVDEPYR